MQPANTTSSEHMAPATQLRPLQRITARPLNIAVLVLVFVFGMCTLGNSSSGAFLVLAILGIGAGIVGVIFIARQQVARTPQMSVNPLTEQVQAAFLRNDFRSVMAALHRLPAWPIRALLIDLTEHMFRVKFAIQRAQNEGVPSSYLERLTANLNLASLGISQMISKLDAVGQQQTPYATLAPRLEREAVRLQRLLDVLHQTQKGLALLTLTDFHHDQLQRAEIDLQALAQAVQHLERAAS